MTHFASIILELESFSSVISWVLKSNSQSSPFLLCTFFKCLPRFPDCENVLWQNLQTKGFCLVCFLKWSLRLHDFLNGLPHFGNRHLNCNLSLLVSGFLVLRIWYHFLGIPSNLQKSFLIVDFLGHFLTYFTEDSSFSGSCGSDYSSGGQDSFFYLTYSVNRSGVIFESF